MEKKDAIENILDIAKGLMCFIALLMVVCGVSYFISRCHRQEEKEINITQIDSISSITYIDIWGKNLTEEDL